ncbi:ABC transporter substrate-binding protein [Paenibacillus sp. sgz302251]|uniref:ABC transporter substrate-binding protein n=1 Tax=Paenibacillus sp. sgz302251 TaxID=3414493 RepID=UPI003C7A9C90
MLSFNKKAYAGFLVLFIFAVAVMSGCGTNQAAHSTNELSAEQARETIRIGYINILAMAPAIIAEKQKLMEEQGLKAEFYSFANGLELNEALTSGRLDIAYSGLPVAVRWSSRGAEIEIIAKVGEGKFGLLAQQDPADAEPFDWEGKKIGYIGKGTGSDILIRGFLLPDEGLIETSVQLVKMEMASMEQAILSGTVDAALSGEPFVTLAELRELKVVSELPEPAVVVLAHKSFTADHPDLVAKFMIGHKAAISYLNDNAKDAAEVLAKFFNIPAIEAQSKTWTPQDVMAKALLKQRYEAEFSEEDYLFYQQLANANYQLKMINEPFDIKAIMNLTWIE